MRNPHKEGLAFDLGIADEQEDLLQAVTTAIPTHIMQCTMLPGKICSELDKLNRNFLWGDTTEKRKIHLLNWRTISRPKEEGGLGIKNAKIRNKALLAKRTWDLYLGSTEIWANVFHTKYNLNQPYLGRWSQTWKSLYQTHDICNLDKGWLIRDGKTINFWHDHWLELGVLRNLISGPLLPNEALLKICDVWDSQGTWNLQSLSLQLPSEISKFILATPRPLIPNQADCIYWKAMKNGQFNSSSAYRLAFEQTTTPPSPGCCKWIWKVNTIPRVVFFLWLTTHDRLPTKTLLYNRKSSLRIFARCAKVILNPLSTSSEIAPS